MAAILTLTTQSAACRCRYFSPGSDRGNYWVLDWAYAEAKPDIDVQVSVQHDHTTEDVVTGVQVGMPIPIFNANEGGIQQARAEITAAQRNVERLQLDLRHRLAAAFQQYVGARFQAHQYAEQILPRAEQTLQLVSRGYMAGEIGYLDMLTAQRTYFQTSLDHIEALRAFWQAALRIDGLLLEGSLRPSPP